MYTQAMDTMGKEPGDGAAKPVRSADEMRLQERFDERIDEAGELTGASVPTVSQHDERALTPALHRNAPRGPFDPEPFGARAHVRLPAVTASARRAEHGDGSQLRRQHRGKCLNAGE